MSEIEKQFFETFGIEPIKKCFNGDCIVKEEIGYDSNICDNKCVYIDRQYPHITDSVLLKLICIYIGYERIYMGIFEIDHFRRFILSLLMDLYKETINIDKKERLKHQVQALFKENNQ